MFNQIDKMVVKSDYFVPLHIMVVITPKVTAQYDIISLYVKVNTLITNYVIITEAITQLINYIVLVIY